MNIRRDNTFDDYDIKLYNSVKELLEDAKLRAFKVTNYDKVAYYFTILDIGFQKMIYSGQILKYNNKDNINYILLTYKGEVKVEISQELLEELKNVHLS